MFVLAQFTSREPARGVSPSDEMCFSDRSLELSDQTLHFALKSRSSTKLGNQFNQGATNNNGIGNRSNRLGVLRRGDTKTNSDRHRAHLLNISYGRSNR